ncbi:unnamed protein product [Thlaspi arvense]|uniref:Disease resistance R13L4/SHOC-2-like LRR domain-containing protein n=1 Tax=Thlaspi arvense TaxID=13288 RepID=A0AAU9RMS5_THLAR|nr:unnamed protein product [Thlaspi arvense]
MTQECTIKKIIDDLTALQHQLEDGISKSEKATVNNYGQPNEGSIRENRPSWCDRVRERVRRIGRVKSHASDSGGSLGGSRRGRQRKGQNEVDADLEVMKLQSDIRQMKAAFENLTEFQTNINTSLARDLPSNKLEAILKKTHSIKSRALDLKEIRRKIFNLKCQIPSLLYKQSSRGLSITDSLTAEENAQIDETGSNIYLPRLHVSEKFICSPAFEEVVEKFEGLHEFTHKLCLLSFAVFPENKEIKRTMLMYWWIGEGFISSDDSENSVTTILDEFSAKKLIEPVEDERKLEPSGYKMEPHVHSAIIYLATKLMCLFDLYDSNGKLIMKRSVKEMVCLVRESSLLREAKTSAMKPRTLKSVFNSSERYPDFTFKWFPEMESLKVLYLGRWERTAKRHIEVESTEFLKNMKALKNLRLASFQGISRIEKLENSICDLPQLVILDLRACYNLEKLPDDIGSLRSLIYLDVSQCYMLDGMPKGIEDLLKLEVLKGFVISQSDEEQKCAVKRLVKLRKLSITVNKNNFTVEKFMESLKTLKQLESLKIAWGATNEEKQQGPAAEEKQDDQVHKKEKISEEKKGDVEEKGNREVGPESGVSSKKEDGNGDGINEKSNLEEGKKHGEVKAESLKSDKAVEGETKASPSRESAETIQKKLDDQKGKSKVEDEKENDGDKGKADQEEGKKRDEVKAESLKSQEETGTIQNKPEDQEGKSKAEGDGDKETKQNEVEAETSDAETSESDKGVEGVKKASPSRELTEMIQKKPDDKSKVGKEANGDKGKADLEEGKKQDEAEAEKLKSDNGIEGVKKESPSGEATNTIQNKPDDHQKDDKQEEQKGRENERVNLEKGTKKNEVKEESSKPDKIIEGDEKTSPQQESKDTVKSKPNGYQSGDKQEEKGDGKKEKVNLEEEKKKDEVKAESSKPDKITEKDEKTSPQQESKDTIQSKPDDHRSGDKQVEKGDGEKEKVNLEEGKKKDEVKAESSKPDEVIEGDEKTSSPQESNTIQSKPDDHEVNSKVHEKGDGEKIKGALKKFVGGEGNTQKSDKNKLGKKVSFSEEPRAPIQKKPDDLKKENDETASPSKPKMTAPKRSETKKHGKREQESEIDTSKLPSSLKKLELECFPEEEPPIWLNPKNLDKLEKLSIKGGKLSRISDEHPTAGSNCSIHILRLKYLHEFKAEWKDLRAQFPKLKLLEKYKCPKVAFCPTDGNGVWRRSQP